MKLHRKRIEGSETVRIVDADGEDIGHKINGVVDYPGDKGLKSLVDALDKANDVIERLRGKPFDLQTTDLRSITRRSDTCVTTVCLRRSYKDRDFKWLVLGEAHLTSRDGGNKGWNLKAYLTSGVTDFEHDSAHALDLPLIGVQLDSVYYHSTHITGYIDPEMDSSSFRVPLPGYNPMKHEDAIECNDDRCEKDPHIIVPEGLYTPPFNRGLFDAVRGKRVEIHIGPVTPKEDQE